MGSAQSPPCGAPKSAASTRLAFWSPERAYAEAFARIEAGFGPATGAWRPLSEDARGFGPAKLEDER